MCTTISSGGWGVHHHLRMCLPTAALRYVAPEPTRHSQVVRQKKDEDWPCLLVPRRTCSSPPWPPTRCSLTRKFIGANLFLPPYTLLLQACSSPPWPPTRWP